MVSIYIDDLRDPIGKFDYICRTPDEAIKCFRKKYKEGHRHFFLELDHDSGIPGHDFIDVLKNIDSYIRMGKMKDLDIDIHFHSGNSVGVDNMRAIIQHNSHMQEVW